MRRCAANHTIEFVKLPAALTLDFLFRIVTFADYVEDLGHPYMWVQSLGGLHFPKDALEVCVETCIIPS